MHTTCILYCMFATPRQIYVFLNSMDLLWFLKRHINVFVLDSMRSLCSVFKYPLDTSQARGPPRKSLAGPASPPVYVPTSRSQKWGSLPCVLSDPPGWEGRFRESPATREAFTCEWS